MFKESVIHLSERKKIKTDTMYRISIELSKKNIHATKVENIKINQCLNDEMFSQS